MPAPPPEAETRRAQVLRDLEQQCLATIDLTLERLACLQAWQTALFADPALTETKRWEKLDQLQRQETALNRQLDTAVKRFSQTLPRLTRRCGLPQTPVPPTIRLTPRPLKPGTAAQKCRNELPPPNTAPADTGGQNC